MKPKRAMHNVRRPPAVGSGERSLFCSAAACPLASATGRRPALTPVAAASGIHAAARPVRSVPGRRSGLAFRALWSIRLSLAEWRVLALPSPTFPGSCLIAVPIPVPILGLFAIAILFRRPVRLT